MVADELGVTLVEGVTIVYEMQPVLAADSEHDF